MKLSKPKWGKKLWIQLQAIVIWCLSHRGSMAKPRGSCWPTSGFCSLAWQCRCSFTAASMRTFFWHESRMRCKCASLFFQWDASNLLDLKYKNCYCDFSPVMVSAYYYFLCMSGFGNCCCFLPTPQHLQLPRDKCYEHGNNTVVFAVLLSKISVQGNGGGQTAHNLTLRTDTELAEPCSSPCCFNKDRICFLSWESGGSAVWCVAPCFLSSPPSMAQVNAKAGI